MAYVCPNLWQLDSRREFDDALENIRAQPQPVRERINSDDRKGLPYYLEMYLEEKNPLLKRRAELIRKLMEEIAQNRSERPPKAKMDSHKAKIEDAWQQKCNVHIVTDRQKPQWTESGWRSEREAIEVAIFRDMVKEYEEKGGSIDNLNITLNYRSWETFKNWYKSETPELEETRRKNAEKDDARVPQTEEASEDETLCGEYEEGDEKLERAKERNEQVKAKQRRQKKKINVPYEIEKKREADSPTLNITPIKGESFNRQISTKFDDDIAHGEHKLATPKPPMPPPPTPPTPTPPQNVSKAELERRLTEFNEMTECTQFFDSLWKIKEDGTYKLREDGSVITKSRSDRDATAERRRFRSVPGRHWYPGARTSGARLIPVHDPDPSPQYTNNTTTQDIVDAKMSEGNTRAIKMLKDIKAGNVKCPVITD